MLVNHRPGPASISKSEAGAFSKITREINAKPENRKTIFGSDIETTTQRDGGTGSGREHALRSWRIFQNRPPTQD